MKDHLGHDLIELGAVSTATGGMPYGIDEHLSGLFVNLSGLALD